jgi:hypothetical protein
MDMNMVIAGVTGVLTGIGAIAGAVFRFEKKWGPKIKEVIAEVREFCSIPEATQAIQEVKEATQADRGEEAKAHVKAAAYCALRVLAVEIGSLTDIQKAAIAKYITDVVPDSFREYVTPSGVESVLQLIQAEILAAQTHSGLQSAQAFIDWLQAEKKNVVTENQPA